MLRNRVQSDAMILLGLEVPLRMLPGSVSLGVASVLDQLGAPRGQDRGPRPTSGELDRRARQARRGQCRRRSVGGAGGPVRRADF